MDTGCLPCVGNAVSAEVIRAQLAESMTSNIYTLDEKAENSKTNKSSFWVPVFPSPPPKPQFHTTEFCQFSWGHEDPGGMKCSEQWVRCEVAVWCCTGELLSGCWKGTDHINTFFTAIKCWLFIPRPRSPPPPRIHHSPKAKSTQEQGSSPVFRAYWWAQNTSSQRLNLVG